MKDSERAALAELLEGAGNLPYAHFGAPRDRAVACALARIAGALAAGGALWRRDRGGRCLGLLAAQPEPWDTEHFGFGCARVGWIFLAGEGPARFRTLSGLCRQLRAWCAREQMRLVVGKVDCADVAAVQALEESGFRVVTSELVWTRVGSAPPPGRRGGAVCVERVAGRDFPGIEAIGGVFYSDRFHADFRLPRAACDALWGRTLVNACRGFADQVIVAHRSGTPLGAIVCKLDQEAAGVLGRPVCVFFLVGVAAQAQGQGLGSALMAEALAWAAGHTDLVEVGTQAHNLAAIRLYQKSGFALAQAQFSLHRHFADGSWRP
jgi:ribosomal protein S18 acetylase RimI-like enzyme